MIQLDETGHAEIVIPLCHWCNEPLDGEIESGMHKRCAEELHKNNQLGHDALERLKEEYGDEGTERLWGI